MQSPSEVERFVRSCLPREMILRLVPGLITAYEAARDHTEKLFTHPGPQADARWALRRAFVEELLREIGLNLQEVMPGRVAVLQDRGGAYHRVELTFDKLRVTQCRLAGRDSDPPKAIHRQERARANAVYYKRGLFDEAPPPVPCFGMLVHGGRSLDAPEFILIRLMTEEGTRFVAGEFDLLAEYERLIKPAGREDIEDEQGPEWIDPGQTGSA